jgi:hypothetical protein
MCTGDELPAAFAKSIEELLSIPEAELVLLIIDPRAPARMTTWQRAKMILSLKGVLWMLNGRLFPAGHLSCYRPVSMAASFARVPRLKCKTIWKGRFSEYFRGEDVDEIKKYDLDFILRFAFGIIRGDVLSVAKYGVWSFHHGDETKFRGGPPAFWEIYHGEAVTGAVLQRLTDRLDSGVVLQKCFIRTRTSSYRENLDAIMWAATYMPARVCRDILRGHVTYLSAPPSTTRARVFLDPNNLDVLRVYLKTSTTWVKKQLESILFSEDWNVGIVWKPIHEFLKSDFCPHIQWLAYNRPGYFIADPFLLRMGSTLKLLVEEFDHHADCGTIVETEFNDDTRFVPSFRTALNERVHMSYPYLLEYNGRYYCVPEAWQKRSVCLYVFDPLRQAWEQTATLINDFAAVDSTIFAYSGRWWLFCTNHDDDVDSKLFLWHSPSLFGPWEAHVANPIKMDVRSSRPAGRPFVFEGQLYRPAQDSSRVYGGGVTINRVTSLTVSDFSEEPVTLIQPGRGSPYGRGIHTLASCDAITAVDGNRLTLAPVFAWRRARHKLRKLFGQKIDLIGS